MFSQGAPSELDCLNDLETVLQKELLARLTGKSPADLQKDLPGAAEKIDFLYKIVDSLRGSYNAEGIRRWFQRERSRLEGKSPLQYLGLEWNPDEDKAKRILELAEYSIDPGAT